MAALPTSLRRTMLMLLAAMTMIVMVFYWNQGSIKPMAFVTTIFEKTGMSRNKLVSNTKNIINLRKVKRISKFNVKGPGYFIVTISLSYLTQMPFS